MSSYRYEYEPVWEKVTTTNPSLDFNNPEALVSIPLFADVTKIKEGPPEVWVQTRRKRVNYVITDQREMFPATEKELYNRQIYSETLPCVKQQRWSNESIKQFLDGKITAIDIPMLYNDVKNKWEKHIDFPDKRLYHLFTLWTIGTYLFPLFHCYPYLYLTGYKDTGKTKALEVAQQLCFNAKMSASMTGSSIFRLVQATRCTLLMDETEKLRYKEKTTERHAEIRTLLLAGYKKGGVATRSEKRADQTTFEPTEFECYSPKIIANIEGIEDVLESRCIPVVMLRTMNRDISETEVDEREKTWQEIRDGLYLMTLLHWREVREIGVVFKNTTALTTRQYELWKPIFILACWLKKNGVDFGEGSSVVCEDSEVSVVIPKMIIELSREIVAETKLEEATESWEALLIKTLIELVKEDGYIPVKTITECLRETLTDVSDQSKPGSRWVGRRLKRLGFKDKRRLGTGVEYNICVVDVAKCACRHGISITTSEITTQTALTTQTTPESEVSEQPEKNNTPQTTQTTPKKKQNTTSKTTTLTTQPSQTTLKRNRQLDTEKILDTLSILERETPEQQGIPVEQISQHAGLRVGIVEPALLWLREQGAVEEIQPGYWVRL